MKEKGAATEFRTINPATEEVINTYEIMTKEQHAFSDWKKVIQKELIIFMIVLRN